MEVPVHAACWRRWRPPGQGHAAAVAGPCLPAVRGALIPQRPAQAREQPWPHASAVALCALFWRGVAVPKGQAAIELLRLRGARLPAHLAAARQLRSDGQRAGGERSDLAQGAAGGSHAAAKAGQGPAHWGASQRAPHPGHAARRPLAGPAAGPCVLGRQAIGKGRVARALRGVPALLRRARPWLPGLRCIKHNVQRGGGDARGSGIGVRDGKGGHWEQAVDHGERGGVQVRGRG